MKKHSLSEHVNDVDAWWWNSDAALPGGASAQQMILFLAYERWLNDRQLLSEEDKKE